MTIRGLAIATNTLSEPMNGGTVVEVIRDAALRRTLDEKIDVRMFYNHDPGALLGRLSSGTLTLRQTPRGLEFTLVPPDTQAGRDAVALIERRDLTGASFGFAALADEWSRRADGTLLREVTDMRVYELSLVALPSYSKTVVALGA